MGSNICGTCADDLRDEEDAQIASAQADKVAMEQIEAEEEWRREEEAMEADTLTDGPFYSPGDE